VVPLKHTFADLYEIFFEGKNLESVRCLIENNQFDGALKVNQSGYFCFQNAQGYAWPCKFLQRWRCNSGL
jgi:hypothetical protein